MAAFVFAPIVSGVESLRMNAMFAIEHPMVDLSAKEAVVPARFAGSLVLAPADKLRTGHIMVRLEVCPVEGPKMGQSFEVIQVIETSATVSARVVVRRANIVDDGCPLLLQFDVKSGENVWAFNDYGVNALVNSSLKSAFIFNNNDTTKLVGFSVVATPAVIVASANTGLARPITASLADQMVGAMAVKNVSGWNVQVISGFGTLFHPLFERCPL